MIKEYLGEYLYEILKNSDNLIFKALEISTRMFERESDKGGYPYILHLLSVYKNVNTEDEKIVALLHDIMEDKNVTSEELLDLGFPNQIVKAISLLTKDKQMEYPTYIENLIDSKDSLALNVKLADLKNNMDLTRIKNPTETDFKRVDLKYKPAYEKIKNTLEEMEK